MTIPGSKITPIESRAIRKCKRCGIEREARASSILCKDCRSIVRLEKVSHLWAA